MNWEVKNYGGEPTTNESKKYAIFIGRYQPYHLGHTELIQQKLNQGIPALIMVRDIEPDEKNPFTAEQVRENITNFYSQEQTEGKVKVIVIPDICSIEFGRGVGYDIIERVPPQEIGEISATKIRKEMGL